MTYTKDEVIDILKAQLPAMNARFGGKRRLRSNDLVTIGKVIIAMEEHEKQLNRPGGEK